VKLKEKVICLPALHAKTPLVTTDLQCVEQVWRWDVIAAETGRLGVMMRVITVMKMTNSVQSMSTLSQRPHESSLRSLCQHN